MGVAYGPPMNAQGLVFHIDAANVKSYGGSGTTIYDLSGQRNTSILTNGATFDSSNRGSFVFDGTNDYIENTTPSLGITGNVAVTLSAWIYFTGTNGAGGYNSILTYGGGPTAGDTVSIGLYDNYRVSFSMNGGQNVVTNTNTISNNIWYNIAIVKTPGPADTTTKIYVNGQEQAIASASSTTPNVVATVLRVGKWVNDASYYFQGKISQASIYNATLSTAEIRQNFNAIRGRYGI